MFNVGLGFTSALLLMLAVIGLMQLLVGSRRIGRRVSNAPGGQTAIAGAG